jgi:hypothetical protein
MRHSRFPTKTEEFTFAMILHKINPVILCNSNKVNDKLTTWTELLLKLTSDVFSIRQKIFSQVFLKLNTVSSVK